MNAKGVTLSPKTQIAALAGILLAGVTVATAGGQGGAEAGAAVTCKIPQGGERLSLDPAGFTTRITNPYWPLKPGSRWVYRETDPAGTRQKVVVTVTSKTKKIANGITARVVHDVVTEGGKPIEVTDDWYAQDKCGNIWYLGEATKEFENGKVGLDRGLLRGRRRRRAAGGRDARQTEGRNALPTGVLRPPCRGPGRSA